MQLSEMSPKGQTLGGLFKKVVDRVFGGIANDGEQKLQRLDTLLRLAAARETPPRCLTCGETLITYLTFDDAGVSSNFVHTCGGRLYRVPADPDEPRFSYMPQIVLLDSEGRLIRQ
jgi:hypothetical protein